MDEYTISIRDQACMNKYCPFYKKKLEGNVVVHGKKYARFKCKECKKTWVGTRHTFHYGLKKGPREIELALSLIKQGGSIRKIAGKAGISPCTVQRWKKKALSYYN